MATAAFRSTSRRTSIGGVDTYSNSNSNSNSNSSRNHHRRSRSVSRFSHRLPADNVLEETELNTPPSTVRRGKFVNTVRGSGFPEISLDDLAIEMFSMSTSLSDVSSSINNDCDTSEVSQRRGRRLADEVDKSDSNRRERSVSRRGSRVGELRSSSKNSRSVNSNNDDCNSSQSNAKKNDVIRAKIGGFDDNGSIRRRRSLSVAPKRHSILSDSENGHFQNNRSRADSTHEKPIQKLTSSNQQRGLRRCNSQKDLLRSYDGYTSYSSTLTDDEGNDAHYIGHKIDKGIRASSALDKGPNTSNRDRNNMSKAVPKEYTHPGRDNRLDMLKDDNKPPNFGINESRRSADCDALKAVSTIRRNYKTKLEESEKRKEELLAEILLEEERGKELKKMVVNLLPTAKETSPVRRHMRGRKRSNDRTRVSKQLVEDADKIIEDFISSFEETDISSFDGERSDTSSILGGTTKPLMIYGDVESFRSPLRSNVQPAEMDGVVLPWLKWETGGDGTPIPGNEINQHPPTPTTVLHDALEETTGRTEREQSVNSKSSRGSWSPGIGNSFCMDNGETSRTGEVNSRKNQILSRVPRRSRVHIDDYLKPPSNDEFLLEIRKNRDTIHRGGLLICNGGSFGKFLV